MSDDLISRQEVLNKLNKLDQQELYLPCHFKEFVLDEAQVFHRKQGQTIVKHGKWEHGRCTECGISLEDIFSGEFYYDYEEVKFCPSCGAKMESEE